MREVMMVLAVMEVVMVEVMMMMVVVIEMIVDMVMVVGTHFRVGALEESSVPANLLRALYTM